MTDKHGVLIYSGGMDSFTLLHDLRYLGWDLSCLSFDYGQKHGRELALAEEVCMGMDIQHHIIDLSDLQNLLHGSALTDDKVSIPTGHYTDASQRLTVVPNRNMIMLSIAIGHAVAENRQNVFYAAHKGDFAVYPDCRQPFVHAMNDVALIANYLPTYIRAPYIHMTKGEILKRGLEIGLTAKDYSRTWTCYDPQPDGKACGKCGACVERLEAFKENGVTDPIAYAS